MLFCCTQAPSVYKYSGKSRDVLRALMHKTFERCNIVLLLSLPSCTVENEEK